MDLQETIAFLSKFTDVSAEEIEDMLGYAQFFTYEKNTLLMQPGEVGTHLFLIISGTVRTYYIDKDGVEHTLGFNLANEPLVDLNCFINQTPTSLYAITLEPTVLVGVSHPDLFTFMEAHPKYETVLLNITSYYLSIHAKHAKLMRIPSAKDRYERFMHMYGDAAINIPLKYIASYLGMTAETLSRVRGSKL